MANEQDEFDVDFSDDTDTEAGTDEDTTTEADVSAEGSETEAAVAGEVSETEAAVAGEVSEDGTVQPVVTEDAQKAAEEKAAAEKAARKAADEAALKEFQRLADEAVTKGDPSTGTLPEVDKAPVTKAYSDLSGSTAKKNAKSWLQVRMQEAMVEGPQAFVKARSYLELFKAVDAIKVTRESVVRTPLDPTEEHVKRVAAMYLAANLAVPSDEVKDGWQQQVQELAEKLAGDVGKLREWLVSEAPKADDDETKADQPEVHSVVLAALRIAQGRTTGAASRRKPASTGTATPRTASSGDRGDIAKHVEEAFAGHPSGTYLRVADMVNFDSSEYGEGTGRGRPSPGAIAARLFPRGGGACTIPGITPTEDPKKGAVKN